MTTGDDVQESLRLLVGHVEFALRAEGVTPEIRDRIVARILYGEPDAPHRIYPRNTLSFPAANRFMAEWNEAREAVSSGAVAPYKTPPPCPGCGDPATVVTAAAAAPGWLQIRPCGCLFDVEGIHGPRRRFPPPEPSYGTPVAPTAFLPLSPETQPPPPGLSRETAEALREAMGREGLAP